VQVAVWQKAPRCRFVGRYSVRADRGAHLLRLRTRVGTHRLRAGTYRFVGASGGIQVLDVRVRLVWRKNQPRVRRDELADVCPPSVFAAAAGPAVGGPSAAAAQPSAQAAHGPIGTPSTRGRAPGFLPPVLGHLNPANASPLARAILFALLGCAIALLAAASLPERAVTAATGGPFVSRHRAAITLGGFAVLVLAALVTVLR
jgi:hypothetical protein